MIAGARSIRDKLIRIVILTTLVAVSTSVAAIIVNDLRSYRRTLIDDLSTQAELLGQMTAPALVFDDSSLADRNLGLLRLQPGVRAAAIYTARGAVFATYSAGGARRDFPQLSNLDDVRIEGGSIALFKRIDDGSGILGTVYLLADYELANRILSYSMLAAAVTSSAVLIALLMMGRLERIITRPILAIAGIARDVVKSRDYSRRAEKLSEDEVGALTESFNAMLAEIEQRTLDLEKSNGEIARLNAELEERVRDRTRELADANAELIMTTVAAEEATQAKSAFLSSMSHELRTPLNAILGFGQLLASSTVEPTAEQRDLFVGHIIKAGKHLLTLINEILDLAKIESGNIALSMETIDLADILNECRTMIAPLAEPRGIRIIFPDRTPLALRADRTRLRQVLLNLLSNAIKYNREQGAVVVDCAVTDSGRLRISVQDTGIGLRPDQLAALFQPFNRLGQETGGQEGTGIGLVVTKRLVELMGGSIDVSSTPGTGSLFWMEFAAAAPSATIVADEQRPPAAPVGADGKSLLLYVEDNPANLRLVEEIVGLRQDLHMMSAPDGNLGVEIARAHLPDVILMDIHLPGVSGEEALRILQADSRTRHIPVIALTASAMPRDVEKGRASGFFSYMTKPLDLAEFNETVSRALASGERDAGEMKGRKP